MKIQEATRQIWSNIIGISFLFFGVISLLIALYAAWNLYLFMFKGLGKREYREKRKWPFHNLSEIEYIRVKKVLLLIGTISSTIFGTALTALSIFQLKYQFPI